MTHRTSRSPVPGLTVAMLGFAATLLASPCAQGQTLAFHFKEICRSAPTASKNAVTVVLHGPDWAYGGSSPDTQTHAGLADVTLNALWTFADYRQNRVVFKYRQDSCVTDARGTCTFHGGSGRARWQLAEVVGYAMSTPAFDTTPPTALCPNTTMIDFW